VSRGRARGDPEDLPDEAGGLLGGDHHEGHPVARLGTGAAVEEVGRRRRCPGNRRIQNVCTSGWWIHRYVDHSFSRAFTFRRLKTIIVDINNVEYT